MTTTFRIKRTVQLHDDHLDINDWLEDSIGPSTSIIHSTLGDSGRHDKQYDRIYESYCKLSAWRNYRPRYAVDFVGETIGPGWKTVVAMEFEGETTMHEDWFIKIKDSVYAVQFKLMTC